MSELRSIFCFWQALDGFFLAIMTDGNIIYVSESVTSLLEHLPVSIRCSASEVMIIQSQYYTWHKESEIFITLYVLLLLVEICQLWVKCLHITHAPIFISAKDILCVSVWSCWSEPAELPAHGGAFRCVQSSVLSYHGGRDTDTWISEK